MPDLKPIHRKLLITFFIIIALIIIPKALFTIFVPGYNSTIDLNKSYLPDEGTTSPAENAACVAATAPINAQIAKVNAKLNAIGQALVLFTTAPGTTSLTALAVGHTDPLTGKPYTEEVNSLDGQYLQLESQLNGVMEEKVCS